MWVCLLKNELIADSFEKEETKSILLKSISPFSCNVVFFLMLTKTKSLERKVVKLYVATFGSHSVEHES